MNVPRGFIVGIMFFHYSHVLGKQVYLQGFISSELKQLLDDSNDNYIA